MSTKAQIIQQYIAKLDAGDVDGSHAYVTDDFVYMAEPKPIGLGYTDSGLDKSKYKDFHGKIASAHHSFKTEIDSITENGERVNVIAKTKFSYNVPETATSAAETRSDEAPYTAEYMFSGDKIQSVKVTSDPSFVAKFK